MNAAEVLDIAREGTLVLLRVAGPIMLIGLTVGLSIALFQALTQIQEITLVFAPKILAMFLMLIVVLPFMGQALGGYMTRVMGHIAGG